MSKKTKLAVTLRPEAQRRPALSAQLAVLDTQQARHLSTDRRDSPPVSQLVGKLVTPAPARPVGPRVRRPPRRGGQPR
jgi:hypothetical protein